jgi:hypothetical protein
MLESRHANDGDTRIVEEMGVWSGSVRIDIAVINGELCGFELKSDRDTLERLPAQADIYSRVFDRIELVVGARHAKNAANIIPHWWGITVAKQDNDEINLKRKRIARINPSRDPYLIAQLLWRDEAVAILESNNLASGWRSKRVKLIHQRLATELPFDKLRACVRAVLKKRQSWLGQSTPN